MVAVAIPMLLEDCGFCRRLGWFLGYGILTA